MIVQENFAVYIGVHVVLTFSAVIEYKVVHKDDEGIEVFSILIADFSLDVHREALGTCYTSKSARLLL